MLYLNSYIEGFMMKVRKVMQLGRSSLVVSLPSEWVKQYKLKNADSIRLQRYKGLGEMNPEELYDTTMNKATRTLKKVTYDDYIETDLLFTKLMGKEVKARKKFIISHFDEVNELDI